MWRASSVIAARAPATTRIQVRRTPAAATFSGLGVTDQTKPTRLSLAILPPVSTVHAIPSSRTSHGAGTNGSRRSLPYPRGLKYRSLTRLWSAAFAPAFWRAMTPFRKPRIASLRAHSGRPSAVINTGRGCVSAPDVTPTSFRSRRTGHGHGGRSTRARAVL